MEHSKLLSSFWQLNLILETLNFVLLVCAGKNPFNSTALPNVQINKIITQHKNTETK